MSASRLIVVHVLIAALVLGHAYDVVTMREHWPFSPYPMYSKLQTSRKFRLVRLTGITYDNPPREMELTVGAYLRNQLRELVDDPSATPQRYEETLRNHLKRFEQQWRWRLGRDIPSRLRGLRLYECQWNLRPSADNLHKPRIRVAGEYLRIAESIPIPRPNPPFGKIDWKKIKAKKEALAKRRKREARERREQRERAATQMAQLLLPMSREWFSREIDFAHAHFTAERTQ